MKEENTRIIRQHGLWQSPISKSMLSQKLRLEDVYWDSDGDSIVWLENRSGKGVLVSRSFPQASEDLTVENNVRAGMGFGGGEFTLRHGQVVFSDKDGKLYRKKLKYSTPCPLTPSFGVVGSPSISPDGKWIVYVFSDHQTDLLAIVDINGKIWPKKFSTGADFYMQPVWHPEGNLIAWIEWNHPNMPWDGTRLKLAKIAGDPPEIEEVITIAGDDQISISQPRFSPDGKWLSFISEEGQWDSLVLHNLDSADQTVLLSGDHMILAQPAWMQAIHTYGWNHRSDTIYFIRFSQGEASLWSINTENKEVNEIDTSPYRWLTQLSVSPVDDQLVMITSSPTTPDHIVRYDGKQMIVERRSSSEIVSPDNLSNPMPLKWTSQDGETLHGYYYPPCNEKYFHEGLPPVIINVHGGPTGSHNLVYTPEIVYFTTRGYAWMEVNYRGSTGYGRDYQNELYREWGIVDVDDVLSAADLLVERKLADKGKLIIKGSSAGGFTTLNCLIRKPGLFKAGICLYGVSNLFTLAEKSHKFEEHYNDFLIGNLPEHADRFYQRSPVFHAGKIRDPLAIFQGTNDVVVPQTQSEEIVNALKKNKIPYVYRLYEGEGHGFRKKETIFDYLSTVEDFLKEFVIYAPDGE